MEKKKKYQALERLERVITMFTLAASNHVLLKTAYGHPALRKRILEEMKACIDWTESDEKELTAELAHFLEQCQGKTIHEQLELWHKHWVKPSRVETTVQKLHRQLQLLKKRVTQNP